MNFGIFHPIKMHHVQTVTSLLWHFMSGHFGKWCHCWCFPWFWSKHRELHGRKIISHNREFWFLLSPNSTILGKKHPWQAEGAFYQEMCSLVTVKTTTHSILCQTDPLFIEWLFFKNTSPLYQLKQSGVKNGIWKTVFA